MQSQLQFYRASVLPGALGALACLIIAGVALSANADADALHIWSSPSPLVYVQAQPAREKVAAAGRELQRSVFRVTQDASGTVPALLEGFKTHQICSCFERKGMRFLQQDFASFCLVQTSAKATLLGNV